MDQLAIELVIDDQKATVKLDNFGQKIKLVNNDINQLGGQQVFAGAMTKDLGELSRRADAVHKSFQDVAKVRLDNGQIGAFTKEVVGAQAKSRQLAQDIAGIRKELANPNRTSSIKFLTDELKAAERELDRFERKLQTVNRKTPNNLGSDIGQGAAQGLGIPFGATAVTAVGVGVGLSFGKESLDAARDAANAQLRLRAATVETGIAYDKLTDSAKKWGDQTLQTNRMAESTFAQVVNFAQAAGRADKLDEFRQKFADLAAAKGIDPKRLGDISRQLVTLQDEATDLLLNANPSAFYDKFAKSIGKTADSLTDAEKRAAVFDEILRRGALFDGSAEQKINASASALDRLNKKFEDSKEVVGRAVIPLVEFVEATGKLITADPKLYQRDRSGNAQILAEQRAREIAENLRASDAKIREAQKNPFGSVQNLALSKVNLATGFFDEKERTKAIEAATLDAQKYVDDLEKRLKNALSSGNQNLIGFAQKEFRSNINLFDLDKREQLLKGFDQSASEKAAKAKAEQEKFNKSVEDGKKLALELGKTYNTVFDNLYQKSNSDNPFVRVFSEGNKALKELRDNLKSLPLEMQNAAVAMQRKINSNALFGARIDNNLDAFDLRERARNLRNPQESEEQRRKRIDDIARRSAESGGFFPNLGGSYGSFLAGQAGGFDKLTDAQKRDIYEARMFGGLSESNQNSLQSAFARDRVRNAGGENLSINERLQKQLDIIYGGASSAEEKAVADRKLISISSGLNPSEINSRLREQLALANENEAARRANYEKESLQVQKDALKTQTRIADNGDKLLAIAKKEGVEGLKTYLEIVDKSNGAAKVTGASANNQDTANYYDLGFAGGTNR